MLDTTEKGGVRNSIRNCLTVFQYDPLLAGALAYNLLTDRTDLVKPIGCQRPPGTSITDTDMKYIRLYLEETYGLTSERKIADAADLAADGLAGPVDCGIGSDILGPGRGDLGQVVGEHEGGA